MKHANINIIRKDGWMIRVNESHRSHIVSYREYRDSILAASQYVRERFSDYTSAYVNIIVGNETIRVTTDEDWVMAILRFSK